MPPSPRSILGWRRPRRTCPERLVVTVHPHPGYRGGLDLPPAGRLHRDCHLNLEESRGLGPAGGKRRKRRRLPRPEGCKRHAGRGGSAGMP
eukprot:scaffold21517_cov99-Isochrysis_galbana.AAC.1